MNTQLNAMRQALVAWQTSVYGSEHHHKAMLFAMTNIGTVIEATEAQPAPVQPLTEARKVDLASNWFAEDWAITKAIGMLHDYDRLLRSDAPPNVATPLAAPVQSLQCFHCQVTIETLNDKVMSLMAQPAERTAVPLTNEQIEEIFQEAAGADEGVVQRFARFIEAAHGITEKGQP